MENYNNFLIQFKSEFWNFCNEQHIFDLVPENNFDHVKNVVDNLVSNYQSQILQNDNKPMLFQVLSTELKNQLNNLNNVTREDLHNQKMDEFQQSYEDKQNEFNSMINKNVPEQPEFNDTVTDEPLSNDKLDELLKNQLEERKHLVPQNSVPDISANFTNQPLNIQEENQVIAMKHIPQENMNGALFSPQPNFTPERQDKTNENYEKIINLLENIVNNQKIYNSVFNKLINSQISILEKLK